MVANSRAPGASASELVNLGREEARRVLEPDLLNVIQFRDFQNDLANTFSSMMGSIVPNVDPDNARTDQNAALDAVQEACRELSAAQPLRGLNRDWTLVQLLAASGARPSTLGELDNELDKADETSRDAHKRPTLHRPPVPAPMPPAAWAVRGEILKRTGKTRTERD